MGDINGPDDLTWNKSEIAGIKAGTKVKLKAIPTTGFYPNDTTGKEMEWSGEYTTGSGLTKEISIENNSKSAFVKFKNENRLVQIELNKLLYDGTAWIPETNSVFDAKGYTITLKGRNADNSITGTNLTLKKSYEWGEVVTLEINAGTHYAVYSATGVNAGKAPEYPALYDYVHDNTHNAGNPTNFILIAASTSPEERGGARASVDGANQKFTMTFRVEDDKKEDAITTITLKHRTVDMKLSTSGGKLNTTSPLPEDKTTAEYISTVKVTNTGMPSQDKNYDTSTYSEDGTQNKGGDNTIKILSGITTQVDAIAKLGSIFEKFVPSVSGALTSTPTLTNGTVKFSANGNTGVHGITSTTTEFSLIAYFKSPIYTPWVHLKPTVDGEKPEAASTEVASYSYTRTTDKSGGTSGDSAPDNGGVGDSTGKRYTKKSTQLKVRHGIPFIIKADGGDHYDVISIDGKTEVPSNTLTITHTNSAADINIVLKHRVRDVKLNIFGGKDDRDTSISKVIISNTGVPAYDKTYLAEYRNVSIATGENEVPVSNKAATHNIKMLSGIDNGRVKITAITSKVHNFHKITGNTNDLGANVTKVEVIPPIDLANNQGNGSYSKTITYSIKKVPENDTGEINVYFRINSYKGYNNGLKYGGEISSGDSDDDHKDSTELFYNKANPRVVRGNIIEVRSAGELIDRYKEYGENFSGMAVHLMNDIYFGKNSEFDGLYNLNGALYGNNNVVFDVAINERAFIHNLNSGAYVNGLTVSRGYINGNGNSEAGIIGTVHANSAAKYVTNAKVTVGVLAKGDHIGGVVGVVMGRATLQYLGNYGNVAGDCQIGGVIGTLASGVGKNYTYLFNRGNVSGYSPTTPAKPVYPSSPHLGMHPGGDRGSRVGGVVGYMSETDTGVSKVYNAGNIDGGDAPNSKAGGIVGLMAWSRNGDKGDITIEDFYNTGTVTHGSGLAGIVVGCREVISGKVDRSKETTPFKRGYNIGSFDDYASMSWGGGHDANSGWHRLKIYDVYFHSLGGKRLNSTLAKATWLDSRLDGSARNGITDYHIGSDKIANDEALLENSSVGQLIKGTTDMKLDNMKGLKDSGNWEDTSGLPTVNEFTSRPTIKDLSEKELLPNWIINPQKF